MLLRRSNINIDRRNGQKILTEENNQVNHISCAKQSNLFYYLQEYQIIYYGSNTKAYKKQLFSIQGKC
jgi:hypothetical protein